MTFAPMSLNILGIKINSVDNSAVVNMGPSQHVDLFVSYKRNQGNGEQNGDLQFNQFPVSFVLDADLLDSNSIKNSVI
jgi:hypothetical protein